MHVITPYTTNWTLLFHTLAEMFPLPLFVSKGPATLLYFCQLQTFVLLAVHSEGLRLWFLQWI